MKNFVATPATDGESYLDLHLRTVQFLNEVKTLNKKRLVVVTHAGVIRSLYTYINKKSLENSFDLQLNYGHIIKLTL